MVARSLGIGSIITLIAFAHLLKPTTGAIHGLHYRPNLCLKNVSQSTNPDNQLIYPKGFPLIHRDCFDIELPYNTTTLPEYVPGFNFTVFYEVQNYLQRWQGVRKLPRCWPYLQKALCSILMPRYDEDNKSPRIMRPSVDMCTDLKKNCKFLEKHYEWPALFNCTDANLYARNCTNDLREISISHSQAICQYPLVPSSDNNSWFKDISGCALPCKYPISNPDDHSDIHLFIRVLCALGLLSTSSAMILYSTNEPNRKSSRIAKVIKRCNTCHIISYIGWSLQIFFTNNIACTPQGTQLYGLPLVANACVLSFFLTYLPSLTNLFWCAYLARLCHDKLIESPCRDKKSLKEPEIDRNVNLLSYGIPSILFATVAFWGQIDGYGLFGICTVGQQSILIKVLFVFTPKIIGNLYGNFYFIPTMFKLMRVKNMKPSLRRNLIRISALASLCTMDVIFSVGNHLYAYYNNGIWKDSIEKYVACNMNLRNVNEMESDLDLMANRECTIDNRPIMALYFLELFSTLATGLVIASWAFCDSNLRGLRRKLVVLLTPIDSERKIHDLIDMTSSTKTYHDNNLDAASSLCSISLAGFEQSTTNNHRPLKNHRKFRDSIDTASGMSEMNRQFDTINLPNQANLPVDPMLVQLLLVAGRTFQPPNLADLKPDPDSKITYEMEEPTKQ